MHALKLVIFSLKRKYLFLVHYDVIITFSSLRDRTAFLIAFFTTLLCGFAATQTTQQNTYFP